MTKHFSKWLSKVGLPSSELVLAFKELESGLYDANLGGDLFKKRIGFPGQGKRGSGRTIVCFRVQHRCIFLFGFAKSEKQNLSIKELSAFKELARILMAFDEAQLSVAIKNGNLIEVES